MKKNPERRHEVDHATTPSWMKPPKRLNPDIAVRVAGSMVVHAQIGGDNNDHPTAPPQG